jgi:predicted nucleic acid-binding protein
MPSIGRVKGLSESDAIAGQAEYLITGDRDLLVLADEFAVPIVTAAVFQSLIQP